MWINDILQAEICNNGQSCVQVTFVSKTLLIISTLITWIKC